MLKKPAGKKQVSFSDLKIPKSVITGEQGFSQSLLMQGFQCDRQLIYTLNRWEKPGKESNVFFGDCAHHLMETFYSLEECPDEQMLDEALNEYLEKKQETGILGWLNPHDRAYYEGIIVATMTEYFDFYSEDFNFDFIEIERQFKVPFNGIYMIGKKDGVVRYNKKTWLFEHKTKGDVNEDQIIRNLDLNFQTQYYLLADRLEVELTKKKNPKTKLTACDGVLYNIIRRTKSHPKKNEKLKDFLIRLREEIRRDHDYFFKRLEVEYTAEQNAEFEFELKHKFERLVQLLQGKRPALKNEAFCIAGYECQYAQACSSKSLEGYVQRAVISPELQ